jgi:potassium efflux system protein
MIPSGPRPPQVCDAGDPSPVESAAGMTRALFLLLVLCAGGLGAQPHPPAVDAPPPAVAPRLERAKAALAAENELDEAARKTVEATLEAAAGDDGEADRLLAEARDWRDAAPAALAESLRLERELGADSAAEFRAWRSKLPELAARDELARRLSELRRAAEQAAIEAGTVGVDLATATTRANELTDAIAEARRLAEEARTNTPPAGDAPGSAALARNLANEARRRLAAARVLHLDAEQATLPDRRRLLELRQRVLQRRATLLDREIGVLEAMLDERTDAELAALSERLRQERDAQEDADPALAAAAERNLMLGEELAGIAERARRAAEQAREAQRASTQVGDALRNTKARLDLGADDDAVGLILLSERRRLDDPEAIADRLESTRRELAGVQLRLIELDEQRNQLDAPEQAIENALRDIENEDPAEVERLRNGFRQLLATRAELLPRLDAAQRELAESLRALERELQAQLGNTRKLVGILDREVLWIPSHEPVSLEWLRRQNEAWADLFKWSRYATSARLSLEAALQRWPLVAGAFAMFVALLWLRHRVPAQLEALSQPLLRVRSDQYRYTARALLLTLLAALPWPLLIWTLGWLLQHAGQAGKFSDSLGIALNGLAGGMLLYQALKWLTRERGLAHLHFRWVRSRRAALRGTLPWLAFGLLPLYFPLMLAFIRGQEPAVDAAGRILLLLFCGVGGWMAVRLLAPNGVWNTRGATQNEPARLRQLLRVAVPALLALLAAIALKGYVLTAAVMLRSVWLSAGAIVVVAVLHGMIARWFLLGERRLALKRLEQKREADAAAAATGTEKTAASGDAMPESEPEEVTLASVNVQTRRLLRALTIALVAVALLSVWADVLPALARLEAINLWSYDVVIDGVTKQEFVTLRGLVTGLAVLVLTFVAARNLPGLVEIGLLSRIHLDAPTRYAITSISRYVIVIGGVIAGLGLLGVRWGQLQWMAAALTVGLGFGLQEIFGNFVSGLIVLFERPYRVGDIITIGEVEGTVTRIRTRATTILDWDNKEVVVPNKTFITERFVNWTLSDSITRVVLKVGVAYNSDSDRVRRLLLEIADSDPRVLKNPPPNCWLIELGASTLDFELRVFVGELVERNQVRHALYQRIIAAFRDAGIEIAFPQMDLWVRQAPNAAGGTVLEAGSSASKAPPPAPQR